MQPYFIPYAGYFRLFSASDLFVIYDCVQFARRGWLHRNRLPDAAGRERWLTLPIEKAPQDVLIRDLQFSPDARVHFIERLRSFPLLAHDPGAARQILETLRNVHGTPVDYIERLLERIALYLGLPWKVIRSSTLKIPNSARGPDRILEIAQRLGASRYVNAPGGRGIYDARAFEKAGVELRFLIEYGGSSSSILTRILQEDRDTLAEDIRATTQYVQ